MKRIKTIVELIDPCDLAIDIGSDHAYTAIQILNAKKAQFVVNVEKNIGPLQQGEANLITHQLMDKTLNVLNDGLKSIGDKLIIKVFDVGIISGLGARKIIDILVDNELEINYFILQPNTGEQLLRRWLLTNGYAIIKEIIVHEHNVFYPIIKVQKTRNFLYYCTASINLGHPKTITLDETYYQWLLNKLAYMQKIQDNNHINKFNKEIDAIAKRIKTCKQKKSLKF